MPGRRAGAIAVAVLGAGALTATIAALVVGQSSPYRAGDLSPLAGEVRAALATATAGTLHDFENEVTGAAGVVQLRAAIKNDVDATTMQDLLDTERWWEPYRARAAEVIGPRGSLATRNVPGASLGASDLRARLAPGRAIARFASVGDRAFVEAASLIDAEDLPSWTLVLARPIDRACLGEWAERAHASLLLSDGHRSLVAEPALPSESLIGHEAEALIVNEGAGSLATPLALGSGLWVWGVRSVPPGLARGRLPFVPLLLLAGGFAVAAVVVEIARRRGSSRTPEAAPVEAAASEVAPARSSSAPSPAIDLPASRVTPPPRRSSAAIPTIIAGGELASFGRYSVISRLGEGGMCELFIAGLAGPEGFQRTFVLKRLKPELARNRSAVDQFIDEAKLGSMLVHSNIVPVYDFGHVGDGFFMAQEYVVGRNVGQIVERHMERLREPLDVPSVLYIVHEALQALTYAHERTNDDGEPLHVVHRDVSPGNILVSTGGEVKLIDFGIAKSEGRVSHTDIGNVKGNAAFMAPEQARGLVIDRRADLFSLGLVAYYALLGDPLYHGSTSGEVFYAAASGPSPERLQALDRLPPFVAQILSRALAVDPAGRYATAEEFDADVVGHLGPGARAEMATLLNALFGPELRPASSGGGGATGMGASSVRRRTG
jgi:hypothetical protein